MNSISNIEQLPADLIINILQFACSDKSHDERNSQRNRIRLVCKKWNELYVYTFKTEKLKILHHRCLLMNQLGDFSQKMHDPLVEVFNGFKRVDSGLENKMSIPPFLKENIQGLYNVLLLRFQPLGHIIDKFQIYLQQSADLKQLGQHISTDNFNKLSELLDVKDEHASLGKRVESLEEMIKKTNKIIQEKSLKLNISSPSKEINVELQSLSTELSQLESQLNELIKKSNEFNSKRQQLEPVLKALEERNNKHTLERNVELKKANDAQNDAYKIFESWKYSDSSFAQLSEIKYVLNEDWTKKMLSLIDHRHFDLLACLICFRPSFDNERIFSTLLGLCSSFTGKENEVLFCIGLMFKLNLNASKYSTNLSLEIVAYPMLYCKEVKITDLSIIKRHSLNEFLSKVEKVMCEGNWNFPKGYKHSQLAEHVRLTEPTQSECINILVYIFHFWNFDVTQDGTTLKNRFDGPFRNLIDLSMEQYKLSLLNRPLAYLK